MASHSEAVAKLSYPLRGVTEYGISGLRDIAILLDIGPAQFQTKELNIYAVSL